MQKILILGGYGNFGKRIAYALAKANIPIIIAGRDTKKASILKNGIKSLYPKIEIEIAIFDIHKEFSNHLKKLNPIAVINTAGPFQTSDYSIPKICIQNRTHYIDLADGRDFVTNICTLNDEARNNSVLVVSGASTVPCLSSAVLEKYKNEFSHIESVIYGISPGQKTESRGFAAAKGVLTYLGKPLKPIMGETIYGWQDIYRQEYPILGKRWMANCDIPDVDIFPKKYGIRHIRFSAGMENSFLHLSMWLVSYLIKFGLPLNLPGHTKTLLKFSNLFNCTGTKNGGMHVIIRGKDNSGKPKEIKWFIIAKNSDGPQIPCVPAIVLAKRIFSDSIHEYGAKPCVAMVTLEEYMNELKDFLIEQIVLQ